MQLVCCAHRTGGNGSEWHLCHEREPGESPGLSRSGMQERPPSSALVTGRRPDREATASRGTDRCAPASPKTCRLHRARRARWLIASRNGRPAVWVAVATLVVRTDRNWIGCAFAGDDHTREW